ncbi:Plastid-lipid associated protein PAP / fibrillin family protein [Rhynchospora pubera]|uniref:Plastid-lipid associated protein PAP / fibrillin family protein n=1 Tax=Rhynchospora pubera TaxID=906938 RepID=A0AAV8CKB8_9POAL|nr:Plastid-lipid associated protein PAP / fibrillin family protein [Rhynchospora pubera]KAJ4763423.1 Plastid-lipid associated protein PAP / fibrillin family protein [Rhynchospora pubera]
MASSTALLSLLSPISTPRSLRSLTITSSQPSIFLHSHHRRISAIRASSLAAQPVTTTPQDLVESILSKVNGTDRGVKLAKEGHQEVADVAMQLSKFCVDEPVKCPLIFGEWDVVYCSVPTSPGGGYRTAIGRLIFKTDEMVQVVEAPDIVRNRVSFSLFGFIDGQVSLKGKLKILDEKWIQVIFEPPELKIGSLGFQYGGESEVKLEITYIDEKIRLGKGSRGSLFVFLRRN